MKNNTGLYAIFLFATFRCQALVEQITRWIDIHGHEVNVCHDCHLDTDDFSTTDTHHAVLYARNSFKIVEDRDRLFFHSENVNAEFLEQIKHTNVRIKKISPTDSANTQDYQLSDYQQAYEVTPLSGLSLSPNTYNAEYRFIPFYNPNCEAEIRKELLDTLNEIASHNDNKILNDYYQSFTKYIQTINDNPDRSFFYPGGKGLAGLDPVIYDLSLDAVDGRILHTLYTQRNQPVIDIIAGSSHCRYVEQQLISLGYIKVETIGMQVKVTTHEETDFLLLTVVDIEQALKNPLSKPQLA